MSSHQRNFMLTNANEDLATNTTGAIMRHL